MAHEPQPSEGGALFQIAQATSSEKAYDHIADMRVLGLGADVGGSGSSSLYAALPEAMGGELKLADEEPTLFEEELEQRAAGKAPEMPMEHEEYFGASNSSMDAVSKLHTLPEEATIFMAASEKSVARETLGLLETPEADAGGSSPAIVPFAAAASTSVMQDFKGRLISMMQQRFPEAPVPVWNSKQDGPQGRFLSTLTLVLPEAAGGVHELNGEPTVSKKASEQSAARKAVDLLEGLVVHAGGSGSPSAPNAGPMQDFKGRLISMMQQRFPQAPVPVWNSKQDGPQGRFLATLTLVLPEAAGGVHVLNGEPTVSKKASEQSAARKAIDLLEGLAADDWGSSSHSASHEGPMQDFKGRLISMMQQRFPQAPVPAWESMQDGAQGRFLSTVTLVLPEGAGGIHKLDGEATASKKASEQSAARKAIDMLERLSADSSGSGSPGAANAGHKQDFHGKLISMMQQRLPHAPVLEWDSMQDGPQGTYPATVTLELPEAAGGVQKLAGVASVSKKASEQSIARKAADLLEGPAVDAGLGSPSSPGEGIQEDVRSMMQQQFPLDPVPGEVSRQDIPQYGHSADLLASLPNGEGDRQLLAEFETSQQPSEQSIARRAQGAGVAALKVTQDFGKTLGAGARSSEAHISSDRGYAGMEEVKHVAMSAMLSQGAVSQEPGPNLIEPTAGSSGDTLMSMLPDCCSKQQLAGDSEPISDQLPEQCVDMKASADLLSGSEVDVGSTFSGVSDDYKKQLKSVLSERFGAAVSPAWEYVEHLRDKRHVAKVKVVLPEGQREQLLVGDANSSKQASEQSAARKALEWLFGLDLATDSTCSSESAEDLAVEPRNDEPSSSPDYGRAEQDAGCDPNRASFVVCRKCKAKLESCESFFFYKKTENDVQDAHASVLEVLGGEKITFSTVTGEEVPFCVQKRKLSWAAAMKDAAFRHIQQSFDCGDRIEPVPPHLVTKALPLRTPTSHGANIEEFLRWDDCLDECCPLKPRQEQLDAYRRCVLHNHVVVLPTGFGKTLIASLVMARMISMNPGRMALMLVDRLPLVEQQKRAFENHTGLIAATLCSETSTRSHKLSLISGSAHALVATAGALLHLLHEKEIYKISMTSFSVVVFDECHHVNGKHPYAQLLKILQRTDSAYRPRLVGLTASPCPARTVTAATEGIRKLLAAFGDNAQLYRPSLDNYRSAEDVARLVDDTPAQLELGKILWERIQKLCGKMRLTGESGCASSLDELMDANSVGSIRGMARERAQDGSGSASIDEADELLRLLSAWECNLVLGPYAANFLMDADTPVSQCEVSFHERIPESQLSAQLVELERCLADAGQDIKCLIFVDTIETAEMLKCRLQVKFSHLKPKKAVGHSSPRGMPLPKQKDVLRMFTDGDCRLIVCTSFLEEGFDVPLCNLVFRIYGRASLIQQVQSRGRARAAAGKLVTISSKSCADRCRMLRNQEVYLDLALTLETEKSRQVMLRVFPASIHQSTSSASEGSQESKKRGAREVTIEEVLSEYVRSTTDVDCMLDNRDGDEFDECKGTVTSSATIKMLLLVTGKDANEAKKNILRSLEDTSLVQTRLGGEIDSCLRLEVQRPGSAKLSLPANSCAVHSLASLALLSVPTGSRLFLKHLAASWAFQVKDASDVCIVLPSRGHDGFSDSFLKGSTVTIGGVRKVRVGFMPKHGTFIPCSTLSDSWNDGAKLAYKALKLCLGEELQLSTAANGQDQREGGELRVTISISKIGQCVFLSVWNHRLILYIPMSSTPIVWHRPNCESDWNRSATLLDPYSVHGLKEPATPLQVAQQHLHMLTMHPILAVEFDTSQWDVLTDVLGDPRSLGAPAFVTRVHDQFENPQPQETIGYTRHMSHLIDESQLNPNLEQDENVINARLAFACLESNVYCLPLHQECLKNVFWEVRNALLAYIKDQDEPSTRRLSAATRAMYDLAVAVDGVHPFIDASELYRHFFSAANKVSNHIVTAASSCSGDYLSNPRVVATPSRLICRPPITMKSSRLMRMFGHESRLVYVTFRDEDGQRFYGQSVFEERYRSMLEPSGIPGWQMQGLQLRLLACSGSQMRDQTAVFVVCRSAASVMDMRARLIQSTPEALGGPFKYMSRLGLYCTADFPTVEFPPTDVIKIKDAMTSSGDKKLTDGSGFICSQMLLSISELIPHVVPKTSCAVQIRHGGNKGVLVMKCCDTNPAASGSGRMIEMRESMMKFDSAHQTLCIVKAATYQPMRLNREALNLIFSLAGTASDGSHWDPFPAVRDMQEDYLLAMAESLTDQRAAMHDLIQHQAMDTSELECLAANGETFPSEHYFLRLLQHIYDYRVRTLRSKTHIPIGTGALLMGIPDPFEVLADREVSIRICRGGESETVECIVGRVLVYRNPLLHPGDLQVLNAVDRPELGAYVNAIVFPAKDGVSERSIASECSGGDLDGDMFSCVWDERLVPPPELEVEAFDYEEFAQKKAESLKGSHSIDSPGFSIAETVQLSMTNACLGHVARTHLALCDIVDGGARNPLAIDVAKQQSLAVDFPKLGIKPEIPKPALVLVKEHGYPDFMESLDKGSRPSDRPLGILYRRCLSVACEQSLSSLSNGGHRIIPNDLYKTEGYASHMPAAMEAYLQYRSLVHTAILKFGVRSEEELILAMPIDLPDELSSKRDLTERALRGEWAAIKATMRSLFFSEEDCESAQMDKASAWYMVAYSRNITSSVQSAAAGDEKLTEARRRTDSELPFLGFAWVVSDVLVKIRERCFMIAPSVNQSLRHAIGKSAIINWKSRAAEMTEVRDPLLTVFSLLCKAILRGLESNTSEADELGEFMQSGEVHLFGSASTFLCVPGSDVDMYVSCPRLRAEMAEAQLKYESYLLKSYVKIAVDELAQRSSFRPGTTSGIPVLTASVETCGEDVRVDICARSDGMYKSMLLRKLYRLDPIYLPFFSCMMDWARACTLVRCGDDQAIEAFAPLKNGEMHALILHVLCLIARNSTDDVPSADAVASICIETDEIPGNLADSHFAYIDHARRSDHGSLERLLLRFFSVSSRLPSEELRYEWPVPCDPRPVHILSKEHMNEITRRCARAHHCLARTQSWAALLAEAAEVSDAVQEFVYKLPLGVARSISHVADFHANALSLHTGAQVVLNVEAGGNVTVHARGMPQQIHALRVKLKRLCRFGRLMGIVRQESGRYFMEGCALLFVKGTTSASAMLRILDYPFDGISYLHLASEVSGIMLRCMPCSPVRWKEEFFSEYLAKAKDQMELLTSQEEALGLIDSLRLSINFGHFYLLHARSCFEGKTSAVMLQMVRDALEGLSSRKAYGRKDFVCPVYVTGGGWDNDPGSGDEAGDHHEGYSKGVLPPAGAPYKKAPQANAPKSLNSGFHNCIFPKQIDACTDTFLKLQEECFMWADAVFGDLGYAPADSAGAPQQGNAQGTGHCWHVEVVPQPEYQVIVQLSDQLEVLRAGERPVRWINGTLLQDNSEHLANTADAGCSPTWKPLDMRLKLETKTKLQPEDNLFKIACPKGGPAIVVDKQTLRPAPSPELARPDLVRFARHIQSQKFYHRHIPSEAPSGVHSFDADLIARISSCVHYEGEQLAETTYLVDISVEVDASPLKQYLREQRSECDATEAEARGGALQEEALTSATTEAIDAWHRLYLSHLLELSERINAKGHILDKYCST